MWLGKNIPRGSLRACLRTFLVYFVSIGVLWGHPNSCQLISSHLNATNCSCITSPSRDLHAPAGEEKVRSLTSDNMAVGRDNQLPNGEWCQQPQQQRAAVQEKGQLRRIWQPHNKRSWRGMSNLSQRKSKCWTLWIQVSLCQCVHSLELNVQFHSVLCAFLLGAFCLSAMQSFNDRSFKLTPRRFSSPGW